MDDEDRYTRITLRIPKELHNRLSAESERTSKSLNAEIVGRLEDTFRLMQVTDFALLLAKLETSIAETEFALLSTKNDLANMGILLEQTVDAVERGSEISKTRLAGLKKAAHWAQQAGHVEKAQLEVGYERAFDAKARMRSVTENWVGEERAQRVAARFDTTTAPLTPFDYQPKPSIVQVLFGPDSELWAEQPEPIVKKRAPRKTKPKS
ncbi:MULTISPECIES: toxin-antitoxin system HicB family antitoxin [unclassified Acidovorax]|uniref:toxin-antitoxin system HicB family antitoxin n=1 Tax=unclassified Acidovorax TaxID=2684926 RepID=UPI001C477241|nr:MULTISPECIES: toxin-antitoxin system HicB family antitoxin [unclassified Acidovorax]MBV7460635.1 type II toxin-antitoxin system HicB family antitoxin [Acidovorax sp. sif0632]MBV7465660.1 type II toxin-antitoxin system HicB family antitoxin [Acidovorax sp. sif0613]